MPDRAQTCFTFRMPASIILPLYPFRGALLLSHSCVSDARVNINPLKKQLVENFENEV